MNAEINIRAATPDDQDGLCTLVAAAHQAYTDFAPDFFNSFVASDWHSKFQNMLHSDAFNILVAEASGAELCAFIILYKKQTQSKLIRPQRRLIIDNIFVAESYRRSGIARALLKHAQNIAERENFDGIELEVAAQNTAAQALYKTLGFGERTRTLSLTLPRS